MAKRQMKEKNATVLVLPFLLFIFSIILLVSSPSNLKINIFKNQDYIEIINSETITNALLLMIGEGVPQFKDFLEKEVEIPSITEVAFESITGIKTDNISTLLLHEIPGFNRATTKIYIAGEGSDYSNLPNESPPPNFDELLKKEDSNKEQAQNSENKSNEESSIKKINDPSVFIYHSHSWEGYLPLINKDVKPSEASSINNEENVVLVGTMLSNKLKEYGITAQHEETNMAQALHDKGWDYNNSYTLSRELVQTVSSQSKSISYYIDIHRDSARKESTTTTINGKNYARLYFVVGQEHENYQENLMFAKEIHEKLEEKYHGLSKGIYLKTRAEGNGVYNQDISSKSILVEVGGIDNDKDELSNTIDAFSEVFKELYDGAIEVNAQ
ncbi:stage II sporulation protein P [Oceanobacillus alkalisoli]|uniref:stage II sporulation protein P n=1 Tax=Oceanobacillus alkalisoli TaxID=2925113 RepID=UPI001EF147FF|nr:stage II sporulation protein P [Oceanobacillus alkalisoli]MCF3942279.1 stage II sporulation protein P [Oceanobacillus alkalisoli]MCG5104515.1 stage II sporulation protein P [Oceanobacillus alkalisoli]